MGTFAKTQIEEKKKKKQNRLPICVNDLNQNSQTLKRYRIKFVSEQYAHVEQSLALVDKV